MASIVDIGIVVMYQHLNQVHTNSLRLQILNNVSITTYTNINH